MAAALESGIRTVNGIEWSTSLRYYLSPFGPSYISGLDRLSIAFNPRSSNESPFNLGDVVEIQGEPACGKTQILYFLCMVTALSKEWTVELRISHSSRLPQTETFELGGKQSAVAVFDVDGRWSNARLAEMIKTHLRRRIREYTNTLPAMYGAIASEDDIQRKVSETLSRIHIFKPTSTISLAATLAKLPLYCEQNLPKDQCTLLLIDSITAFYWQDRCTFESAKQNTGTASNSHPIRFVISALAQVRHKMAPLIVMTSWAFSTITPGSIFYRPLLPYPYPAPFQQEGVLKAEFDQADPVCPPVQQFPLQLSHHITLRPMPVDQFAPDLPFSKALGDEGKKRNILVKQRGFTGYLRMPVAQDSGDYPIGSFDIRVAGGGVEA